MSNTDGETKSPGLGWFLAEHFLFLVSLALLVPPVPSEAGQLYRYRFSALFIAVAMTGSRLCAIKLGRESWTGLVLKVLFFLLAGFFCYQRLQR